MKKNIHPKTQKVIFQDIITGKSFLTESTIQSTETKKWIDGVTYPIVKVETSSFSHPAFNKSQTREKESSQREKFEGKYGKKVTRVS